MTCRPTPAAAAHCHSSTRHWQPCDLNGFRYRMALTSGSMHAERLL